MNDTLILVMVWITVVGLCIGSFLNVVALRGLSGESIVFPPSKCPKCKNKLKWWMNIPVLSYIFLRGKCHYCKEHISIQYPIVEALTGILFLAIFLTRPDFISMPFFMAAVSLLIVMSLCDIKESVIFDFHAYILIALGVIYHLITGGMSGLWFSFLGGFSGFAIYEIFARSGYLFAGERAFGEGDSLIAAGIGAFFGWIMMLYSIVISILIMAVFTLPYFMIHSYKSGKKKTLSAIGVAMVLVFLAFLVTHFNLIKTFYSSLVFLVVIMIGAIWCGAQILSDMNKTDENGEKSMCMLPFGPSMAVSFVLIMFFEKYISSFINF